MIASHGSDALAHHAANVAAIAIPVGSILLGASPYISLALMLVGFAWYGVLFYDRFFSKHPRHRK